MTRAAAIILTLALGACSICPDGYRQTSNSGAYGFVKCHKEND